jgi:hypothetical protein
MKIAVLKVPSGELQWIHRFCLSYIAYLIVSDILVNIRFVQNEVFWLVTTCRVVVGYRRFGGPSCLHLQAERSFKDLDLNLHLCENPTSLIRAVTFTVNPKDGRLLWVTHEPLV